MQGTQCPLQRRSSGVGADALAVELVDSLGKLDLLAVDTL